MRTLSFTIFLIHFLSLSFSLTHTQVRYATEAGNFTFAAFVGGAIKKIRIVHENEKVIWNGKGREREKKALLEMEKKFCLEERKEEKIVRKNVDLNGREGVWVEW